ncbi:MAG: hypothetical protein JWP13_429 [Candidatus Saccharibacteria bacterium]|nr:hypothetical protein [Candidatus Saccharibacteria bacterium]
MAHKPNFSVTLADDFVHLNTWGSLHVEDVEKPVEAALKLAKDHKVDKLLDNIQEVDFSGASIPVQAKGMGVLWRLRNFRKVAVVFRGKEPGFLFFSSLQVLHLNLGSKFQGFDNEADAIAWLKSSN